MTNIHLAAGLIAALACSSPALAQTPPAQPAPAQNWPQRTVRLILPLGPGSATDVTARLYAERLSERWGKPVVVENRPGPDALVAVVGFIGARDEHTLLFSFGGMMLAFGVPTPALDHRQAIGDLMMVAAAAAWAATTLVIKASSLNAVSAEKTMLYQLVVSAPMFVIGALAFGERMITTPSGLALGSLAYQTIWVVSVTFVVWFALIQRYSASRLSAFTFLTPLFGVAAGYLVLDEPLNPAFAAAVALVVAGLVLVNRPARGRDK